MIPGDQIRCIVWAQWRSLLNQGWSKGGATRIFTVLFSLIWYGLWASFAWVLATSARNPATFTRFLEPSLPVGFLLITLYWQVVPLMMVSAGLSLDLTKLLIYPIPRSHLFAVEALLRISTAVEMMLVTAGLGVGMLLNPRLPVWSVLALLLLNLMNVFVSAGLRDLAARLFARKGTREILAFAMVLLAVLPQAFLLSGSARSSIKGLGGSIGGYWPWASAARLASGHFDLLALAVLIASIAAAWWFARRQFERSLMFDQGAANATAQDVSGSADRHRPGIGDRLARIGDRFLPDPLGVLVWKELRFLSRAPRFRLLFLMGFSFGLLVWLPLVMRSSSSGAFRGNFLTIVCAYSLMLLGEVLFWNQFGMDRSAVQTYFVTPVSLTTVFIAKNIAAACFLLLELAIVAVACTALRFPVSAQDIGEAFGVAAILTVIMLGMGNILSTRAPRPIDPTKSWRSSAGRAQAYLLFLYPVASVPIFLAYGARYALETDLAFWAVIAIDLLLAAIFYHVALQSAVAYAQAHREEILTSLSGQQSPMAG